MKRAQSALKSSLSYIEPNKMTVFSTNGTLTARYSREHNECSLPESLFYSLIVSDFASAIDYMKPVVIAYGKNNDHYAVRVGSRRVNGGDRPVNGPRKLVYSPTIWESII